MPYKYVEDITMADVAFVATGKTIEEMFESAGLATTNVMVADLKKVAKKITRTIKAQSDSIEKLLFSFLDDILFYKDKESLLLCYFDVDISESKGQYTLKASASGDKINHEKHEMLVDIKAVTWHKFYITKKGKTWECRVILDI